MWKPRRVSKKAALIATAVVVMLGGALFWWLTTDTAVTPSATVAPDAVQLNLLTIADWGDDTYAQRAVAESMGEYAASLAPNKLHAVLSGGDNIYPDLDNVSDADFEELFEKMYDKRTLDVPFYMLLGNHDYSRGKSKVELEYARTHPESRWKLPAKWYRVDLPPDAPLATALMLDSNYRELSKEEWRSQMEWLETELQNPRNARWLIVCAHHPVFTQGEYGDSPSLIEDFGTLLRKYDVDFYVCGHDHVMQHLEVPGYVTSFLCCGGGGGTLHEIVSSKYGPFAKKTHGFVHLRLGEHSADVTYLNRRGVPIHSFSRPVNLRRATTRPSKATSAN